MIQSFPSGEGNESKSSHSEIPLAPAWACPCLSTLLQQWQIWTASVQGCVHPQVHGLHGRWATRGGLRVFLPKRPMRLTNHKEQWA